METKGTKRGARGQGSIRWKDNDRRVCELRFVVGQDASGKALRDSKTYRPKAATRNGRENEAQKALDAIIADVDKGEYIRDPKVSIAAYLRQHVAQCEGKIAVRTHARYVELIERLILGADKDGNIGGAPYIGRMRLKDLLPEHLDALYSHLLTKGRANGKGGLSVATVRQAHMVVHKALKAAVKNRRVAFNAASGANPGKIVNAPVDFMTASEMDRIVERLRDSSQAFYMAGLLGASGAMRLAEVLGLRWVDIEERSDGKVMLTIKFTLQQAPKKNSVPFFKPPKSGKPRKIILDADVAAELRRHKALQDREREAAGSAWIDRGLVITRSNGDWYKPGTFSPDFIAAIKTAKGKLGIAASRKLNHKSLRHSCLTDLAKKVPPFVLQRFAGHKSYATTEKYLHLDEEVQSVASDARAEERRKNLSQIA